MGITRVRSTVAGGYTPVCNSCGVHLCWDISEEEARAARSFWNAWVCQDCNGGVPMSLKAWRRTATLDRSQENSDPRSLVAIHH